MTEEARRSTILAGGALEGGALVRGLVAALVMVAAGCSTDRLIPYRECDLPCYPGPSGTLNVGACSAGAWRCSEDPGEPPECVGAVVPVEEIACDGLDNNCDGYQHWADTDHDGDGISSCAGDCAEYNRNIHPGAVETCNSQDDNCDGREDEGINNFVRFCYGGPDGTVMNGVCHPGVIVCEAGIEVCRNWKGPTAEVCDTLDNDCDGKTDEGLSSAVTDYVVCIDESGSMSAFLSEIASAVERHAQAASPNNRYALCVVPSGRASGPGGVLLVTNFTDASTFAQAVKDRAVGSAWEELTYDALYMIAREEAFPLERDPSRTELLAWRAGSNRVIVLFADEEAQSARSITEQDLLTLYGNGSSKVFVFGLGSNKADFDSITSATGGAFFDLTSNLSAELNSTVLRSCEP